MTRRFLFLNATAIVASVLGLIVSGCASTKVTNKVSESVPAGAPSMIYVRNMELGGAKVREDPGTLTGRPSLLAKLGPSPAKKLDELGDRLEKQLVKELQKDKFASVRLEDSAPQPSSGWVISGELLEVAEGNRLQRAVFGFGAGNSDVKLYVTVADASKPKGEDLLDFNIASDGSKLPGGGTVAVVTHSPVGMAASFVINNDGSDADIERVAKAIAEQIKALAKTQAKP